MKKFAKTLLGGVLTLALALGLLVVSPVSASASTDVTIHFYNSDSWSSVYAYYTTDGWSTYGFWPDALTQNAYNTGWYDFTVSVDSYSDVRIIFVADTTSWSAQTVDIALAEGTTEAWVYFSEASNKSGTMSSNDCASTTMPTDWDDGSGSGYVISLTPSATSITAGETVTVTATIQYNGITTELSNDMSLSWSLDNSTDDTANGLTDGTLVSDSLSVECTLPTVGTYYVMATLTIGSDTYTSYTAITTKEAATYDTTTVYFDNTNSAWSSVYLYMTDSNWTKMEGYEDYATWPGVQLTANSSGLYEVSIPDNLDVYLIFNDGTGGDGGQTADLLHEAGDGTQTYSIASEAATTTSDAAVASAYFSSGVATAVTTISVESDATYDESTGLTAVEITSTEDLEEGVTYVVVVDGTAYEAYVEDGVLYIKGDVTSYDLDGLTVYAERENTTTVYFTNTAGWTSVYVYITDSAWSPIEGLEDYATWPGVQLTANSDGLYEVTIPDDIGVYLIFSDGTGGAGAQTNDLLHEAGAGSVTYNADGSDIKAAEDDGSDTTSKPDTADATPIIPIAFALLGCAVIAVSSKRRAA